MTRGGRHSGSHVKWPAPPLADYSLRTWRHLLWQWAHVAASVPEVVKEAHDQTGHTENAARL